MTRDELIKEVAKYMMIKTRGFTSENDYPIEWDTSRDDSQISMIIEDISEILRYLERQKGYAFGTPTYNVFNAYNTTTTTGTITTGAVGPSMFPKPKPEPKRSHRVQMSASISVTTPENPTIGQIEEFLQRLKDMSASPETIIKGALSYTLDLDDVAVGSIGCGDCDAEEDFIVMSHECD